MDRLPLFTAFLSLLAVSGTLYVLIRKALLQQHANLYLRVGLLLVCSIVLSPGIAGNHGAMLFPAGIMVFLQGTKANINFSIWIVTIILFAGLDFYFGKPAAERKHLGAIKIAAVGIVGVLIGSALGAYTQIKSAEQTSDRDFMSRYIAQLDSNANLLSRLNQADLACLRAEYVEALQSGLMLQEDMESKVDPAGTESARLSGAVERARDTLKRVTTDGVAIPAGSACKKYR